MPGPWAEQNLQMPLPGTDKAGKCPAVAGGGGGCTQVELTDALFINPGFCLSVLPVDPVTYVVTNIPFFVIICIYC